MSRTVISAENLGKEYIIGGREAGGETFRETVVSAATAPFRRLRRLSGTAAPEERMWALKGINFEVKEGEVVGIIGRNGAGKSTLLKILSRITAPTEGRVEIRGRVSSLLEVGTGFHPELTGRENIYLNGAILGMGRAEISAKFDEIVDFSGVERFLDTPVKRYSSGMSVRLAFSVAAHLEPEILIVDEVLAVGDAEFQKKCLGRMGEVARRGRTVLFVSHNLSAVSRLCEPIIWLEKGRIEQIGPSTTILERYGCFAQQAASVPVADRADRGGDGRAKITSIDVRPAEGAALINPVSGICIRADYQVSDPRGPTWFLVGVYDSLNRCLFFFDSRGSDPPPKLLPHAGVVSLTTDPIHLRPGRYFLNVAIADAQGLADHVQSAATFDVLVATEPRGAITLSAASQAICALPHAWQVDAR